MSVIPNHLGSSQPPPIGSALDKDADSDIEDLPSPTTAGTQSPSPSVSSTSVDIQRELREDADRQWHETLQQLELVLTMVLVPYIGKYYGRKCAFWGWAKYMEWMYPVSIDITDRGLFKASGAVEAASSL